MTPALRLAIAAVLANKFSRTTTMNNTTDTTNSGAAANTCKCGLGIADCCANACQHTEPFPAAATKATSGEAWQYPHDVPDALADKALSARVPGGSSVRDWFLPHESERAQSNVRDAMKCALFDAIRAAAPAPAALIVALKTPDGLHTEHAPACRCGSAALRLVYDGYGSVVTGKEPMTRYYVTCHGCEARGPVKPTAAEAAAAWRHMIGAPAAPVAGDGMVGFSLHLDREQWGAVIDGLILERDRSEKRKAANPASNSDARAEMCAEVIRKINAASQAPVAKAEPIGWEYRHYDSDRGWGEWERVKPRNPHTDTVDDRVAEIREYIKMGYKYELRALYTSPAAQADDVRDAVLDEVVAACEEVIAISRSESGQRAIGKAEGACACIDAIQNLRTSAAPADKQGE